MDARPLTVRRHEWAQGRWEMVKAPPAAPLRGLVRDYTGYSERSALPLSRTEVPSSDVALIISFGPRIPVSGPADAGSRVLGSFVAPLHESRAITEYEGEQHGVEVRLTPPGARMALGLPMGELTELVTDLDGILGTAPARRLVEHLHDAPGWEQRFTLLDAFLARRLLATAAPHTAVLHAWRRIVASDGRVAVSSLTEEVGWSGRHLASRFRADIGLTPKALARIVRFQRVTNRLRPGRPATSPGSPRSAATTTSFTSTATSGPSRDLPRPPSPRAGCPRERGWRAARRRSLSSKTRRGSRRSVRSETDERAHHGRRTERLPQPALPRRPHRDRLPARRLRLRGGRRL